MYIYNNVYYSGDYKLSITRQQRTLYLIFDLQTHVYIFNNSDVNMITRTSVYQYLDFSFCKCLSQSRPLDKTNTSVIVSLPIQTLLFCPSVWRGVDGDGQEDVCVPHHHQLALKEVQDVDRLRPQCCRLTVSEEGKNSRTN